MWMVHFSTRLAALVFSSISGQWQAAASKEWRDLFLERGESNMVSSPIDRDDHGRHYAYGCFYWESAEIERKELLVFDTRSMEFSISDLPPGECFWSARGLAIVEAGEGRIGLFGILNEPIDSTFDLSYYIKGNAGESSSKWQLEKTVSLGSAFRYDIKAATGTYLLLGMIRSLRIPYLRLVDSDPQMPEWEYISVDVKTLRLDRVCSNSSEHPYSTKWIYTNFPPSLSSPKI
ncbi:uncharacterized protein LOC124699026 [Lolium rigidum]|uniref:uncharacterized protein LOC124699026 n=1 Tax=Lolium rigidum TaxID=89674 RepID=UPI001F5D52FF|nr:uncharacterized protein LOC124699026 [Lolium rigidum]